MTTATTMLPALEPMRRYFTGGATQALAFRKERLQKLKDWILQHEEEIYAALYADLKKGKEECWVTELGIVISAINLALRNLKPWMRPQCVSTNWLNFPSSSRIVKEPLGVVLIIGPWNYPFQLLLNPLVGAIAAGNCVVIKPSEMAPATEAILEKLCTAVFESQHVRIVTGNGSEVVPAMIGDFRFDHIFYTGSTAVGRIIYKLAAEQLVPVTLELGGKSPCIIERDANIDVAARRIVSTKFSNAGQMCVAPDYVLVHHSQTERFSQALIRAIRDFYGDNAMESDDYGKIINTRQFDRLVSYLDEGNILYGGKNDRTQLYLQPTLLTDVTPAARVMQEEIFGPILPLFSFSDDNEALAIIEPHANPLAFYIFTQSSEKAKYWMQRVPSGGACINNAALHFTNEKLPFGGRGFSGTGYYHGKYSFDTFTHQKAVLSTPNWPDPNVKYPPFKGKLRLLKWIIR